MTIWEESASDKDAMRHALELRDQDRISRLVATAMNHGATQQEATDAVLHLVMELSDQDRQWWVDH